MPTTYTIEFTRPFDPSVANGVTEGHFYPDPEPTHGRDYTAQLAANASGAPGAQNTTTPTTWAATDQGGYNAEVSAAYEPRTGGYKIGIGAANEPVTMGPFNAADLWYVKSILIARTSHAPKVFASVRPDASHAGYSFPFSVHDFPSVPADWTRHEAFLGAPLTDEDWANFRETVATGGLLVTVPPVFSGMDPTGTYDLAYVALEIGLRIDQPPGVLAPLRQFPRDDELASGSAARHWPSSSEQMSLRRVGYF